MSLRSFLHEARGWLKAGERVTVVLGNASADLDSVASAVVFAASGSKLRRKTPDTPPPPGNKPSVTDTDGDANAKRYVPIVNIAQREFRLRTDIVWMLGTLNIGEADLIFKDDTDFESLIAPKTDGKPSDVDVVLVDHNAIGPRLNHLGDSVVRIIDHHADEQIHMHAQRTIAVVGSCSSLIAEAGMTGVDKRESLTDECARFLLAAIVADTICMDKSKGKYQPKDGQAIDLLMSLCDTKKGDVNLQDLFESISKERNSIQGLTADDLLARDYKERKSGEFRFGMSSICASLDDMSSRQLAAEREILEAAQRRMDKHQLSTLVIMTVFSDDAGAFRREIAVFGATLKIEDDVSKALIRHDELNLKRKSVASIACANIYDQYGVKHSRKAVLPMIDSFFKTYGSNS